RPGVVPQQRRPDDVSRLVQADHAMLLPGYRDGGDVADPASLRKRGIERAAPVSGIDLGAVGMGRLPAANQRPAACLAYHHLARLGRRVDASYPIAHRAPIRCSIASWFSRTNP